MSPGEWIEMSHVWHETRVLNCPVCGRLILRRAWQFDGGDGLLRVCSQSCEELYESYWKHAHGSMKGQ